MTAKSKALLWLVLLGILGGLFFTEFNAGLKIETNILKLLPKTETDPFAEKAFEKFSEKNLQQVVFMFAHANKNTSKEYAQKLVNHLSNSPYIDTINSGFTEQEKKQIGQLGFEHRYQLLTPSDKQKLQKNNSEFFTESSLQLLYSPMSASLAGLMLEDPFLASYRFSNSNSSGFQAQLEDGLLIIENQQKFYTLISARLAVDSFSSSLSQQFIPKIDRLEKSWKEQQPELELLKTGSVFYASHGMKTAKREVSTIGLGSLIAVISLLIIAFISIRPLLLATISLGVGVVTGFVSVHLLFGQIHILTLVFGASLIGVAIDYAFHYFASATHSQKPLKSILAAISLGLASSIIGYLALLVTPFPALQQMATFCILGLTGAFLTVVLFFDLVPLSLKHPKFIMKLVDKILHGAKFVSNKAPVKLWLLFPLIAGLLVFNYSRNNDDIRQLQNMPVHLKAQETKIVSLLQSPAANQFFIIKGQTKEILLSNMEALTRKLETAITNKAISSYSAISQWVPSANTQKDNYNLYQNVLFADNQNSPLDLYKNAGFLNEAEIKSVRENFTQNKAHFLQLEDWLKSPVGKRFDYLWLDKIDDEYAAVVALNEISNMQALELIEQSLSGVYFVNKVDKVSVLFKDYRLLVSQSLLLAIAVIFLFLSYRYGFKLAGLIILPPVLAMSITLIALVGFSQSINLFNTLALFLILGIGIDYGLFFAENKSYPRSIVVAICLSALTTIFSFGLLCLSQTPAIYLFGLTMLIGISSVLICSLIFGDKINKMLLEKKGAQS